MGEDLVGLLHTRTARTLWGRGKQLKDGRQKAKTVGEAVDFGGWGQEAKKEGSGGSSPKVREGRGALSVPSSPAPLPCLWLWWITLISLQSLGLIYSRSRDTTMHWVLPVYSSEAGGLAKALV